MYHISFIYSSVVGHLGCFDVLVIVNSAAINIAVNVFFELWFSLDICLGVGWLDQMVVLFLIFLYFILIAFHSKYFLIYLQFSSVTQSYPTLCDPMNRSTPGLPVHHHFPELTQTHIHRVGDTIQPSHPWSSPSPPALNPSQHQSLFQRVNSSHEVAKVLEFQP